MNNICVTCGTTDKEGLINGMCIDCYDMYLDIGKTYDKGNMKKLKASDELEKRRQENNYYK